LVLVESSSAGGEQRGNNGTGELHCMIIFVYLEKMKIEVGMECPLFYSWGRPVLRWRCRVSNYRIGHGTLILQHPTMSQWLLHRAGRGLLGNGSGVYWRGIGMPVMTNVSQ
jgi:hypothetical protein